MMSAMEGAVLPVTLLQAWTHAPTAESVATVLPDGCRDLICLERDGHPTRWFVSALADTADHVHCRPGERYRGYRLQPAALFDPITLVRAAAGLRDGNDDAVLSLLADVVSVDANLAEMLDGLSRAAGVAVACRDLGVSERLLERLVKAGTGRTPGFWRGLARVRRAAAALSDPEPLAAIAADHGYADQAHMSRDFRKWFATTPTGFRSSPSLLAAIRDRGYD
jgi:AraC-like DNA-binding protein